MGSATFRSLHNAPLDTIPPVHKLLTSAIGMRTTRTDRQGDFLHRHYQRRGLCLAIPMVVLACLVVLSPLLRAPLLFDDEFIVQHDPYIASLHGENVSHVSFFDGLLLHSRPVRLFTHRLDAILAGTSTVWPHTVNLLLHIATGLAFLFLLGVIGVSVPVRCGALALFLLHPICVESVGIVSHRKEMLSAFFLLLALPPSLSSSLRRNALAIPALLLAVFSKETAVVFPLLWSLVGHETLRLRRQGTSGKTPAEGQPSILGDRGRFLAWALLSVLIGAVAFWQIRHGMEALRAAPSLDPDRAGHFTPRSGWAVVCSATIRALPGYLVSFAIPWGHCVDPAFPLDTALRSWPVAASLLVWFAYVHLLVRFWRHGSRFFTPLAWIGVGLLPYLFPPLLRSGGTAAFSDRYAYLAAMGFSWFVAEALVGAASRVNVQSHRIPLGATMLAVLLFEGVCSFLHATSYRSSVAFWDRVCRLNPGSFQARFNYAHALWKDGKGPEAARTEFERMRALCPDFPFGIASYADFLCSSGKFETALEIVAAALERRRGNRLLLVKRAQVLFRSGRYRRAWDALRVAEMAGAGGPAFDFECAETLRKCFRWPAAHDRYMKAARAPRYQAAAKKAWALVRDPQLPMSPASVVVFGDSVPHGTNAIHGKKDRNPFSERLSERFGGVPSLDRTLPDSTSHALGANMRRLLQELPMHPRWCVVWTGHNDAFRGRSATGILADIAECIVAVREEGVKPLVVGPIPIEDGASGKERDRQEATLSSLDSALECLCESANVAFVSSRRALAAVSAPPGGWLVSSEGIHLGDSGLDVVADACCSTMDVFDHPCRSCSETTPTPCQDGTFPTTKTQGRARFALCQTQACPSPSKADEIVRFVRKSANGLADVVVLPELAFSSFREQATAWRNSESLWTQIAQLACEYDIWIVANHPVRLDTRQGNMATESNDDRPAIPRFNETRVVAPDGSIACTYRKRVLAKIDEETGYTPGTTFAVARLPFADVGLLICKDWFFPRITGDVAATADLLVVQFAHPGVDDRSSPVASEYPPSFEALEHMRNARFGWSPFGKPMLAVNKAGGEGPFRFVGGSFSADADGRIIADLGTQPDVLFVDFPIGPDGRIRPEPRIPPSGTRSGTHDFAAIAPQLQPRVSALTTTTIP